MSNPNPTLDTLNALANQLTNTLPGADVTFNTRFNPEHLCNNCFFVTLAVLLGTNARDLCNALQQGPAPGSGGIALQTAAQVLTRLGPVQFNVWVYNEVTGGGPIRGDLRGVSEATIRAVGLPRVVGVAYRRQDGSGHVVICRNPGTGYRRYMDYQVRSEGQDVTSEVRQSRICMIFAIDRQNSTGGYVDQHAQEIEQMETDAAEQMETDQPQSSGFWGGRFHDEL
ncbi:hypothetical protein FB451DRAFT_255743 [Mycena latifolia]|nr:hypothetical protein FB451DRAFT_255743 [Mycena latifolia]